MARRVGGGTVPGSELSITRAEPRIAGGVTQDGGRNHLPADLHIDSGIDLGALLGERAPRPRVVYPASAARGDEPPPQKDRLRARNRPFLLLKPPVL